MKDYCITVPHPLGSWVEVKDLHALPPKWKKGQVHNVLAKLDKARDCFECTYEVYVPNNFNTNSRVIKVHQSLVRELTGEVPQVLLS